MKRLGLAHLPLARVRAGQDPVPMIFEGGATQTIADILVRLADRQVGVPQGEAIKKCKAADKVDRAAADALASGGTCTVGPILENDEYKLLVGLVEAAFNREAMQIHGLTAGPLRLVAEWLDDAEKYEPERTETAGAAA